MICSTASASETSPGTAAARPPDSFIRATTSSAVSLFRSLTTTCSPSLASFSAIARPIPLPAPVTRATREHSGVIDALLSLAQYSEGRAGSGSPPRFRSQHSKRGSAHASGGGFLHELRLVRILHV